MTKYIQAQKGFTIVELTVVMLILSILLAFGIVQLNRSMLLARDKERTNDIEIISTTLENIYKRGSIGGKVIPSGDGMTQAVPLGYPSTSLITETSDVQTLAIKDSIGSPALSSPLQNGAVSLRATLTTSTPSYPSNITTSTDLYYYQPLKADGSLCSLANSTNINQKVIAPRLINECVGFNLYYISEIESTVKLKKSLAWNTEGL